MKVFTRFAITIIFLSLMYTPVFANEQRVEKIAESFYKAFEEEKFSDAEELLQPHIDNNTTTRHGTDTVLATLDLVFKEINAKIEEEKGYKPWLKKAQTWKTKSSSSMLTTFFLHRLEHEEAWHFKNSDEWDSLLQSIRRKYQETLGSGYNNALKIIKKYPNEWRIHAHLTANHTRYKLTAEEFNEHFFKVQKLKPGEVSSMTGRIPALSPMSLGRDDEMIAQGIQSILKKYPDRNLSKPEYIDAQIKQEIEDKIFELSIGRVLLTARKYVNETPEDSSSPQLIPLAYKVIYEDIEDYYKDRPQKLQRHPLSIKRTAVWNEITQSYNLLNKRFPKSAQYLADYLEIAIDLERLGTMSKIIQDIEKNDPTYDVQRLSPMQCVYYSSIKGEKRTESTDEKMYEKCRKATEYKDEEVYLYRAGWAARRIGNYEESNQFIEKALKLNPRNPVYLTDICWNHKDLKRYDKAIDYCDRAITINRSYARAWLGRSHIYYYGFENIEQAQKDAAVYERLREEQ